MCARWLPIGLEEMTGSQHIPQRTIDSVIDVNISEESPVSLILMELKQHFPDERVEVLQSRAKMRLEAKARSGEICFYRRERPSLEMIDMSIEEGVVQLSQKDNWDFQNENELVAYRPRPNRAKAGNVNEASK
jgi:hypothetical protein